MTITKTRELELLPLQFFSNEKIIKMDIFIAMITNDVCEV